MYFILGTKAKEVAGPDVIGGCLWCGKEGALHTRVRKEWLTLFHFVPIIPMRTVFVRCPSCGRDMIAKCSLAELERSNPMTLKYLLTQRVSFVGKTCVILGLLLCWAFYVGLIPAIIGFIYGRKYGGWMKTWSIIGLILNILSPLIFISLGMLFQLFPK